jgi:chorismate mutase/prephenate dehydratase
MEATTDPPHALSAIRKDIDRLDARLLDIMAERHELARSTLDVKRENGLFPTDGRREAEVVRRGALLARERGLEPELVREILWRVIELSKTGYHADSHATLP